MSQGYVRDYAGSHLKVSSLEVGVDNPGEGTDVASGGLSSTNLAGTVVTAQRVVEGVTTHSGAGALPITHSIVRLTTTAANAITLADGVNGQRLTIIMVADQGAGTVTPATKTGFTTLTFDDVGDSADLVFLTTVGWMLVGTPTATAA